jgi:hypothetical protein
LTPGIPERVGLAVKRRIARLHAAIVTLTQQSTLAVEQRGTDRDPAFGQTGTRFAQRDFELRSVVVRPDIHRNEEGTGADRSVLVYGALVSARRSATAARALLTVAVALCLAACNPLFIDPTSVGGELETTGARYEGPSSAWVEISVRGASAHTVYALALIELGDLEGPQSRACLDSVGATVECAVTQLDVRMPDQRVVLGDGSSFVGLMTIWSGEPVQIVLVCVDPDTQELGCPGSLRAALRAVDGTGALVGDLTP